jgi:hypothetical protein
MAPIDKDPEVVDDLFAELQRVAAMPPDHRRAYAVLNRVFLRTLDRKTSIAGVRFGGTFAKTDYLLKEYHASRGLRQTTNDARVRLRRLRELDDRELAANFWYDLKAISQFVAQVFQVPVPGVLAARFPESRTTRRGIVKTDCLRVILNRWDDTYLYAEADGEDADEVRVFYGGTSPMAVYKDWDWSYLRPLLRQDCQLNLVRPHEQEGVLYPELIIFEPDYLVDISAVAACFESYATTPLNHLLNRIKPAPTTSAIVLGNLAGQFLDEELCASSPPRSYAQSVQRYFRDHALSLLTTELEGDFHAKAQSQQQNIRRTLGKVLPDVLRHDGIQRFDASEIMVEPSFFSEMLGLQGRMDFLHLDHKVLIEQKSGKGGFPQRDPDTPTLQQKHYVQLLLYLLLLRYNYPDQYRQNGGIFAFLLYSKYKNGLLPLSYAPGLVFDAIRLRNEITANEYAYTRGSVDVLANLTANSLNMNKVSGVLWERYQKPQIESLLAPIREATALERAYFFRFMTFLETEHLMAKIGNQTTENSGFADKWHSSIEEKLQAGNIFYNLTMESPTADDHDRVDQVVLRFAAGNDSERCSSDITNFRTGDIVILYPYAEGTEPDARRTMVHRATIATIEADRIVLSLRTSQVNSNIFYSSQFTIHSSQFTVHSSQFSPLTSHPSRKWAIEHDFFESSFSSLYRGLYAFLSAPKARRDLLLLQRPPRVDTSVTLSGDYGCFNELSLRAKQAQDFFLIIGPPGTGKTSYGLMNTLKEELLSVHCSPSTANSQQPSVLLLSYTNRAIDEICSKLTEASIDFIRIGGRFSCDERYRSYLLDTKVEQCKNVDDLRQIVAQTRVFVGTTTAFNSNVSFFRQKQFSLAIIDEASQILEPHLIGLLSACSDEGVPAIRKFVFIGDHKQLPAVVQQKEEESKVDNPLLNGIGLANCRLSLFERLLKRYRHDPSVVYMLTRQGRMHHDIAAFPNHEFYQDKLQEVPLPHQTRQLPIHRIAFVAVESPVDSPSDKVNSNEAQAIAATVVRIYHSSQFTVHSSQFDPADTVGVIVPYRNQIAEVRRALEQTGIAVLRDITIDTVERFQGSQRQFILYGFTVQHPYQIDFLTSNVFEEDGSIIDRKLNVAMTRAREGLILFGNPKILSSNVTFSRLMAFARKQNSFFDHADAVNL